MQRPKRKENEDDLLRFQEQFLRQGADPSAKVQRVRRDVTESARDIVKLDETGNPLEPIPKKKSRFKTQQEQKSKAAAKKDFSASELLEHHDDHIATVLTRIQERHVIVPGPAKQNRFDGGFPAVPQLGKDIVRDGLSEKDSTGKKQSLFARQFKSHSPASFGLQQQESVQFRDQRPRDPAVAAAAASNISSDMDESAQGKAEPLSFIITGDGLAGKRTAKKELGDINSENREKLATMTKEEILEEQKKLESSFDPKVLAFLKDRRKKTASPQGRGNETLTAMEISKNKDDDEQEQSKSIDKDVSFDPHREFKIDKQLPGMGLIEEEKFQWMKEAPTPTWKGIKSEAAARFDLSGCLIPPDSNIPLNIGLHHHGEEPNAPGYKLDELFQLARSNFLQQRVFALQMLARIMEEYHKGSFNDHLQGCLLQQLLDAGLPFLLRWSLDESTDSVHCAAIYAFSAMLWFPTDNIALDRLLYHAGMIDTPYLKPKNAELEIKKIKKEEQRELADPEIIGIDLIKGLIRMKILPRLRYILEMSEPDETTINHCLCILQRIALHSMESSYQILKCPRLIETIFTSLLPITWSDTTHSSTETTKMTTPFSSALRLIRILCLSGRSIAFKLWKDFDLQSRVVRYVSCLNESNLQLASIATEALHIWRICLLYGLACAAIIDVYPLLISLLQRYANDDKEEFLDIKSSLVLLAEAVIQMTSPNMGDQLKTKEFEKKVHFSQEINEDISSLDWSMTSGIHAILVQSLKKNASKEHLANEVTDQQYISCLLQYLSTYAEKSVLQACEECELAEATLQCKECEENFCDICFERIHRKGSRKDHMGVIIQKKKHLNKVDILSELDSWMNTFITTILESGKLSNYIASIRCESKATDTIKSALVDQTRSLICKDKLSSQFSDLTRPCDSIERKQKIQSLPDYGMKIFKGGCRCLGQTSPFTFLCSLTRLLSVLANFNKRCCTKVTGFLTSRELISYVMKLVYPDSVASTISSMAISAIVERNFLYNLISLFVMTCSYIGVENMDAAYVKAYHQAALKLIAMLQKGEEERAITLMSEFIFQRSSFMELQDMEYLAASIGSLELAPSSKDPKSQTHSLGYLLKNATDKLPQICDTYLSVCFENHGGDLKSTWIQSPKYGSKNESFFKNGVGETMLPSDWLFLPIIRLYNLTSNAEIEGKVINQLTLNSIKALDMCLSSILLFEILRLRFMDSIPIAVRLVRILCVFLIGHDAFLEAPVYHLLKVLGDFYTHSERMEKLDLEIKFPGIASFYDLYSTLLMQYSATSFGDPMFSNYLLIPLQQKFDVKYRKAIWGEYCEILRIFSLRLESVTLSLKSFLEPVEQDEELLQLYIKALNAGSARPSWCPFLYHLAVHHLCHHVFNTNYTEDFSELKVRKLQLKHLNQILNMKNEEAKMDILFYEKMDIMTPTGFTKFERLPAIRQFIIENRTKAFS